jgi:putative transposase
LGYVAYSDIAYVCQRNSRKKGELRGLQIWTTDLSSWPKPFGALFIEPGGPWENGYIESFNGKLRDELFNGEIFTTLQEAKMLTEVWRREYDQVRPHSSLGYKPPAPETVSGPLSATAF